jgi:outer membrane protein TolC
VKGKTCWTVLFIGFCLYGLAAAVRLVAQDPQDPPLQDPQGFLRDYSRGPSWFPGIFQPYRQQPLAPALIENTPRLRDLIHDGKLELSLADALALALENNQDIAVQRYVLPIAKTDVLRTAGGQAARGISGALIPSGLSAGALGAGVSAAASGAGVGNAGGITGGGGAVQIGPVGNFDPAVQFNFSWDRTASPLNTQVVAGIPTVTTSSTGYTGTFAQLFPTGTSYFLSLTGLRAGSDQKGLLFNPDVVTRFSLGFNQPLLSGFGLLPNERFVMVARNNRRYSEESFRLQVITTVVQVENAYWDLAAFQQNIRVAEQSLAASRQLLDQNKKQAEVGTMAHLDVVSAESEVAAGERDLVVARTNLQIQETTMKKILSKKPDPALDAAQIEITTQLPEPRDADIPQVENALTNALTNRPDLREAQSNIQNQDISVSYTKNNLLPGLNTFGLYAGSGLQGNTSTFVSGAADSLGQTFGADFPEYAGGMTISLPFKNRSAQADNLRAQLEKNQLQVGLQSTRNQIQLEVRQAIIGLIQGKAQVEAAHQAVRLAQETYDAEQKKLAAGVSTSYNVILRQRDLTTAQYAEVQAVDAYSKALVEMDRSIGATLDRNGIQFDDAVTGTVTKMPTPPFNVRGFTTGGQTGTR